jgi:hypothetical protein
MLEDPSRVRILAFCGREGAGKSTCEQYFIPVAVPVKARVQDPTVMHYIIRILFGYKESDQEYKRYTLVIKQLFVQHLSIQLLQRLNESPIPLPPMDPTSNAPIVTTSFAEPLKLICAQIYKLDYDMLL